MNTPAHLVVAGRKTCHEPVQLRENPNANGSLGSYDLNIH